MRIAALAFAAGLAVAAAWAQQAPLPPAEDSAVPQTGFDPQPSDDVVPQPRFIRAPGEGAIEVSPLAPPGSPAEPQSVPLAEPQSVPLAEPQSAPLAEPQSVPLAEPQSMPLAQPQSVPLAEPQGTAPGGTARGATAQGAPAQDELPDGARFLRADEPDDLLLEQGAGIDALDQAPDGADAPRQRRFKSAPGEAPALARPTGPAVPIDTPPTGLRQGVRLRELDKMTGQTETFEIAVGETRQVDRLKIRLEACRSPESNDTHGTIAFLKIWDVREPDEEAFSGWMFAESPSLSALDHPRYDLWVISCTTSAVAVSSPSE